MPVPADDLARSTKQVECRGVLFLIELVRVLDRQFGLMMHEEEGRIGDMDGAVIGLHPPLIRLSRRAVSSRGTPRPSYLGGSGNTSVLYISTFGPHM